MSAIQSIEKEWVSDKLWHIRITYHFFEQYIEHRDLKVPAISQALKIVQTFSPRAMANAAQISASQPKRRLNV